MIQRFEIPIRLPGMNEIISENRRGYHMGAKLKREAQAHVVAAILSQGIKQFSGESPVMIRFRWIERDQRRDKDNIAAGGRKIILDALVQAGVLAGDGWRHVVGFSDEFCIGSVARVEVLLEEEPLGKQESHQTAPSNNKTLHYI